MEWWKEYNRCGKSSVAENVQEMVDGMDHEMMVHEMMTICYRDTVQDTFISTPIPINRHPHDTVFLSRYPD